MITAQDALKLRDSNPVTLEELERAIVQASKANLRIVSSGDFNHRPLGMAESMHAAERGYKVARRSETQWEICW